MIGGGVEYRFYVKLAHWSANICLAKIIYVMSTVSAEDTYLPDRVQTAQLD